MADSGFLSNTVRDVIALIGISLSAIGILLSVVPLTRSLHEKDRRAESRQNGLANWAKLFVDPAVRPSFRTYFLCVVISSIVFVFARPPDWAVALALVDPIMSGIWFSSSVMNCIDKYGTRYTLFISASILAVAVPTLWLVPPSGPIRVVLIMALSLSVVCGLITIFIILLYVIDRSSGL